MASAAGQWRPLPGVWQPELGVECMAHGLSKAVELNGARGKFRGALAQEGQTLVTVEFGSGKLMNLRPHNVSQVPSPDALALLCAPVQKEADAQKQRAAEAAAEAAKAQGAAAEAGRAAEEAQRKLQSVEAELKKQSAELEKTRTDLERARKELEEERERAAQRGKEAEQRAASVAELEEKLAKAGKRAAKLDKELGELKGQLQQAKAKADTIPGLQKELEDARKRGAEGAAVERRIKAAEGQAQQLKGVLSRTEEILVRSQAALGTARASCERQFSTAEFQAALNKLCASKQQKREHEQTHIHWVLLVLVLVVVVVVVIWWVRPWTWWQQ
eukprot:TRINITY_DN10880_c0_g1_i4.p2 TRINITY_DN10880_c0_g1~~TRINITY_DN10880_c0_g1_i4.p2  ORF type:complete len:359 (+),score=145.40 TRINITY_DN10880_c0_g1_i4:86-1078(+)